MINKNKKYRVLIYLMAILLLLLLGVLIGTLVSGEKQQYISNDVLNEDYQTKTNIVTSENNKQMYLTTKKSELIGDAKASKPPRNTIWLGSSFKGLKAVGRKEPGGFGIIYLPEEYKNRVLGGDGVSSVPPLSVFTLDTSERWRNLLEMNLVDSGTVNLNGKKIQSYENKTLLAFPVIENGIKRVVLIKSSYPKLLKAAYNSFEMVK